LLVILGRVDYFCLIERGDKMYNYASHLAGRHYKVGYDSVVCSQPRNIRITSIKHGNDPFPGDPYLTSHYFKRKFQRNVTTSLILRTIRDSVVCLNLWGGQRVVFINPEATVVITSSGALVTVWTEAEYDEGVRQLLSDAGY